MPVVLSEEEMQILRTLQRYSLATLCLSMISCGFIIAVAFIVMGIIGINVYTTWKRKFPKPRHFNARIEEEEVSEAISATSSESNGPSSAAVTVSIPGEQLSTRSSRVPQHKWQAGNSDTDGVAITKPLQPQKPRHTQRASLQSNRRGSHAINNNEWTGQMGEDMDGQQQEPCVRNPPRQGAPGERRRRRNTGAAKADEGWNEVTSQIIPVSFGEDNREGYSNQCEIPVGTGLRPAYAAFAKCLSDDARREQERERAGQGMRMPLPGLIPPAEARNRASSQQLGLGALRSLFSNRFRNSKKTMLLDSKRSSIFRLGRASREMDQRRQG
ncbi:predicted protein [Uncinocarpus reesii 1704]|uniref:Uncharacterized protein n=1 Tax=Uncinocarpus reesii (strain UAMH 1704) TaxID=336963 RepID=C4JX64_UNCRE|nr:uncharacterized protein UREG_06237 [Uncinocarpus reesii 1704]EEP81372.1 predicted protein [Uncinocarpus reesii 1704]